MKLTRKFLCALLVAALLVLSVMPAYAAVKVDWNGGKIYLGSSNDSNLNGLSIDINGLTAKPKITNIKSSNSKCIRISNMSNSYYSWKDFDYDQYSDENYNASIYVLGLKKGKATVSFKVDGKKFSKELQVLDYVNALKSFKLTGISSSNLKSKYNKSAYYSTSLNADARAGSFKVAAISGWKISYMSWDSEKEGNYRSFSFGSGVSSASMPIPKMKKDGSYYINVELVNTKTKASMNYIYSIYPPGE